MLHDSSLCPAIVHRLSVLPPIEVGSQFLPQSQWLPPLLLLERTEQQEGRRKVGQDVSRQTAGTSAIGPLNGREARPAPTKIGWFDPALLVAKGGVLSGHRPSSPELSGWELSREGGVRRVWMGSRAQQLHDLVRFATHLLPLAPRQPLSS